MTAMLATVDARHRSIIAGLTLLILFFVVACIFDGVIPVCHYLFGCDHAVHAAAS
ncbi:MAG TPA: hypothetical protein VLA09_09330 [Longimicrobiales bacterium]|nr:hypothetical protein [Longimicrobiales bacterium]